jgi:hypothetical protein
MSVNPFIEIPNSNKGLYQLVGTPNSNYNKLLYGKALLACYEGRTIYFIDNKKTIEKETLVKDLHANETLLSKFFIFRPKTQIEFFETLDDLELFYLKTSSHPTIFVSNIFEFLFRDPRTAKKTELLVLSLGFLKTFSEKYDFAVFVTNETRKKTSGKYPFLSYLLQPFFDVVYMLDYVKGKQRINEFII